MSDPIFIEIKGEVLTEKDLRKLLKKVTKKYRKHFIRRCLDKIVHAMARRETNV